MVAPADLSFEPIAVTRAGYDNTGAANTGTDTVLTTKRERLPWPNQGTLTAAGVWMTRYIYSDDAVAGATNSSNASSPKPVCAHALPGRRVIGDTLVHQIVAYHASGIACVAFTATDGTTSVTQKVFTPTILTGGYDRYAVTGYACSVDVSTLANDVPVTLSIKVYPRFGVAASVRDTASQTDPWRFSNLVYYRSTSRAANPPLAYVSPTGNNTTGVISTDPVAAAANPFLTDKGALDKAQTVLTGTDDKLSGLQLRFAEGTYVAATPANANLNMSGEVIFTAAPGAAKANVIYTFGTANGPRPRCRAVRYKGITVRRTGAFYLAYDASAQVVIEDSEFDLNGNTGTLNSTGATGATLNFLGANSSSLGTVSALKANASLAVSLIRGSLLAGASGAEFATELRTVLGSDLPKVSNDNSVGRDQSGIVISSTHMANLDTGGISLSFSQGPGGSDPIEGVAIVQAAATWAGSTGSGRILAFSADGATANTDNIIFWHNTLPSNVSSGRVNAFYDETDGVLRTHKNISMIGNLFGQFNIKQDVFQGSGHSDPNGGLHVGGWSVLNGVGCRGNFSQWADASGATAGTVGGFSQEYPGPSCNFGTSLTVKNDPLFVSSSNVRLQAGSPAANLVTDSPCPYDLDGNPRAATDAAGAYRKAS